MAGLELRDEIELTAVIAPMAGPAQRGAQRVFTATEAARHVVRPVDPG